MLKKIDNGVISLSLAGTPAEVAEYFSALPPELAGELPAALETEITIYRYHPSTRCAYYIERQGPGIAAWQWSDVRAVHEYGELMAAAVGHEGNLTAEVAAEIFERSTGRSAKS